MGGGKGYQTFGPAYGNPGLDQNNDDGYLPSQEKSQHTINNKLIEMIILYRSKRKPKQNKIIKVVKIPKKDIKIILN